MLLTSNLWTLARRLSKSWIAGTVPTQSRTRLRQQDRNIESLESRTLLSTFSVRTAAYVIDSNGIASQSEVAAADNAGPTVSFEKSDQQIKEDAGDLKLNVFLSAAATDDVTIPVSAIPFSQLPGGDAFGLVAHDVEDFSLKTTSLVIPKGQTSGTVVVTIVNTPGDFERFETFKVILGAPTGGNAQLGIAEQVLKIIQIDPQPTVTIVRDRTVAESAGTTSVTVTMDVTTWEDVSVPFSLDGTAANPADYTVSPSSPLVIPKGQKSAKITLTLVKDGDTEPNETAIIKIDQPSGGDATLGTPAQATITISDQPVTTNNQVPSITSPTTVNSPENQTAVQTVEATDPDDDTVIYTISGGADATFFAITTDGKLSFKTAPDVETQAPGNKLVYEVEVTADDQAGGKDKKTIQVTVTPVNEDAPTFSSPATFTIPENKSIVGRVNATDADLPKLVPTLKVTGGADAALFQFSNANFGELQFKVAPDFENPTDANKDNVYEVIVTADDNDGVASGKNKTSTQSLNITVTDAADPPVIGLTDANNVNVNAGANGFSLTLPENSAQGTLVGTLTATPVLAGLTATLAVTDPKGAFAFDPATGKITVAKQQLLDFEATKSFTLNVTATDNANPPASRTTTVTVNLSDVKEVNVPPVIKLTDAAGTDVTATAGGFTLTLPENSILSTLLGTLAATTGIPSQTVTLSLNDPKGAFAFDTASGKITVAKPDLLDFETTKIFTVNVTATDNATPPLSSTVTVTVNLSDVTEAGPPAIALLTTTDHVNASKKGEDVSLVGDRATFTCDPAISLDGAVLTVSGATAKDQLLVLNSSYLRIGTFVKVKVGKVTSSVATIQRTDGLDIAEIGTGGMKGVPGTKGVPLVIKFNNQATAQDVAHVLKALCFWTTDKSKSSRTIKVQMTKFGATDTKPGASSNIAERRLTLNANVPSPDQTGPPLINMQPGTSVRPGELWFLDTRALFGGYDSGPYPNAVLTVTEVPEIQGQPIPNDTLTIVNSKGGDLVVKDNNVFYRKDIVGIIDYPAGSNTLTVTFTDRATAPIVSYILQRLAVIGSKTYKDTRIIQIQITNLPVSGTNPDGLSSNLIDFIVLPHP